MSTDETIALLRILRVGWPDIQIEDDTIRFWMWAFESVSYAAAEDAAKRYIRTGKFPPKPADLLELAATAAVAPGLIPEEAWAEVRAEARRVGFNRPPTFHNGAFTRDEPRFSSPLIERAVAAVGWETVCTGDNSRGFVRDAFVKALAAIARHEVKAAQTGDRVDLDSLPEGVTAIGRGAAD
jgi:hypothetical protein